MCSFDSPGEPWTEKDYENHYNRMNLEDAEYYLREDALRSLDGTISTLEEKIEELTAVSKQGQQRDDVVRSLDNVISTLERAVEESRQERDAIRNSRN